MVVQVIEGRYTVDSDVLAAYLTSIFEKLPFEIIHPEESHEKWKVNVPRELTRDELVELQRKFRQVRKGA